MTTKEEYFDDLVENCTKGIMQALQYLYRREPDTASNLGDLTRAAWTDVSEESTEWIFEFIKDGITPGLVKGSVEDEETTRNSIRLASRGYLKNFCWCESIASGQTVHVKHCMVHEPEPPK